VFFIMAVPPCSYGDSDVDFSHSNLLIVCCHQLFMRVPGLPLCSVLYMFMLCSDNNNMSQSLDVTRCFNISSFTLFFPLFSRGKVFMFPMSILQYVFATLSFIPCAVLSPALLPPSVSLRLSNPSVLSTTGVCVVCLIFASGESSLSCPGLLLTFDV